MSRTTAKIEAIKEAMEEATEAADLVLEMRETPGDFEAEDRDGAKEDLESALRELVRVIGKVADL